MALGEIYTHRRGVGDNNRVPGTNYYVRAVGLLQENQDYYEEPSLMQVEVLTLLVSTCTLSWKFFTNRLIGLGFECPRSNTHSILLQRYSHAYRSKSGYAQISITTHNPHTSRTRKSKKNMVGVILFRSILCIETRTAYYRQRRRYRCRNAEPRGFDKGRNGRIFGSAESYYEYQVGEDHWEYL